MPCYYASIKITQKRGLFTRVSGDDLVARANEIQRELGEGPFRDVRRHQDTVVSPDLAREQRCPDWAARVRNELGVVSMVSFFGLLRRAL